ncbi:MAB_1171c family putative transporter [Streptomyces fractus]|uniref:MAB_1171c family putative transporter n=1 Tax=Streptomyces fractus TaxID=641806 RepID=UPI003CE8E5BB
MLLGYLGASLYSGARTSWKSAGDANSKSLARGLRLIGLGLSLGIGYSVIRMTALITGFLGADAVLPGLQDRIGSLLLFASLALVITGSTLPALDAFRFWHGDRQALLRLYPLWSSLTEAVPTELLSARPRRFTDRIDPRAMRNRLYLRTMEIRDAALDLNAYAPDQLHDRAQEYVFAHGLIGTQAETAIEACRLAAARQARLRGDAPTGRALEPSGGGRDLANEISALTHLSAAYHSDLTRAFLATEATAPNDQLENHR